MSAPNTPAPAPAPSVRVLPAAIYDALELSALAHGGIGQPRVFDYAADPDENMNRPPCCIHGHAYHVAGEDERVSDHILATLESIGVRGDPQSDAAVRAINRRNGRPLRARVPFSEWAAELGVVRGAE